VRRKRGRCFAGAALDPSRSAILRAVSLPPEPKSSPLIQTLRWSFRPLPFMQKCREEFGDSFSVKFMTFERPMVMISDPLAIKALYMEREHGLPPGREIILTPIVGARSLLVTEGADHLAHRKVMLPPFHGERMRSYQPLVEEIVNREIDSWPVGGQFAIHPRMQAITLEVILRVVFGVADGPRLEQLRVVLTEVLEETASPFNQLIGLATRRFGGGPWARFEAKLEAADKLLYAEIAEHRANGNFEEREDILSLLMQARFEDGEAASVEGGSEIAGHNGGDRAERDGGGLGDTDLRDQLMTLLLAGHETTATALAWTFDLLLRHPRELSRLRESLERGEDDYLRATISESLRLRPVVPLAGRRLAKDLVADGINLPAGTDVTPAIWLAHTRADSFPEPFAFRPERFLEGSPDTYAWIPFGGGIRRCIGAAFAEFEMRIALREVLTRCELHKASPAPEKIGRRNITLSPKAGTPVVLTARHPAREGDLVAA
jgi:cytochrome P450 family 135